MPTKSSSKKLTKTGFVRSLPKTLSAKDVIAKGKAAGLELTEKSVYAIRYEAKVAAKKKSHATAGQKPAATKAPAKVRTGVEDLLRAAASEIGLSRAIALLQEQQQTVRVVLGG